MGKSAGNDGAALAIAIAALGAAPYRILALVDRQGLVLAMIGGVIGLSAAAGLSGWIASLLFGVSPLHPVTFVAAAAASYLTDRQAACVNPMNHLRGD